MNKKINEEPPTELNTHLEITQNLVEKEEYESDEKEREAEKKKTSSSAKTVFNLTNSMVGSSILILPTLYQENGIITNLIVSIAISLLSHHTCHINLLHLKSSEVNMISVYARILGVRTSRIFGFFIGINMIVTSIPFYLMIVNMLFPIVQFFLRRGGCFDCYADKFTFTFSTFSFQWCALIGVVIVGVMIFVKELNLILKIGQYGFILLLFYCVFLLYIMFDNVAEGRLSEAPKINYFTWNFPQTAGLMIFACAVHLAAPPIVSNNMNQKNNSRDLKVAYIAGSTIYIFIGVVGYLGIVGRRVGRYNNLMDFFEADSFFALIIQILFLTKLITVIPIISLIGRNNFLAIFYKSPEESPDWAVRTYNITILVICTAIGLPCLDPGTILSLQGSLLSIVLIYLFPIACHLKCLSIKRKDKKEACNAFRHKDMCKKHEFWESISEKKLNIAYLIILIFSLALIISRIVTIFVDFD